MVSCSGVSAYRKVSGTGRCTDVTTAVGLPVRRVRSFSKKDTSPRVADIRTNWAFGSSRIGHLPRPAAVGLGVEVELVGHDLPDRGLGTEPQRDVRQDFGRAADDRGVRVDTRVAGHHPDVVRAEDLDELEELLRHQCLDGRGVVAAAALGERGEVRADGDEALPGAGRRREDDVRSGDDLHHRLLLRRVQLDAPIGRPGRERFEEGVGVGIRRQEVCESHQTSIVPSARRKVGRGNRVARGKPVGFAVPRTDRGILSVSRAHGR